MKTFNRVRSSAVEHWTFNPPVPSSNLGVLNFAIKHKTFGNVA